MAVTRGESQRQTRERLVCAAMEAVAQHGYAGSSIGTIVDKAGFTKGAFFSNFDSKDAILLELLERHYAAELEGLSAMLDSGMDAEALSEAIGDYIDQLAANVNWVILGIELALRASRDPAFAERFAAVRSTFTQALGALLAQMFERAGRRLPGPPGDIGSLVLSVVQGLALTAAAGTPEPTPSRSFRLMMQSLMATSPPL
jgi:AcrR family transcriptional regulator